MNKAREPRAARIVLHPGDCRVSASAVVLSTLLGSCIAVCLYDPQSRVMGMNHFLLADRRQVGKLPLPASDAGRYGIHAMELLINGMLAHGAVRARLQAKVFGGGNVLGRQCEDDKNFMCIGAVNVRFVREFLERDRIPMQAADLGGNVGRLIHFDGRDFSVYVRRFPVSQNPGLVEEERLYWGRTAEAQQHAKSQTEYW